MLLLMILEIAILLIITILLYTYEHKKRLRIIFFSIELFINALQIPMQTNIVSLRIILEVVLFIFFLMDIYEIRAQKND